MASFETGKSYFTRSAVDADFRVVIEVLARTEKTIRVRTSGKEKTLRVRPDYSGNESVMPWGRYSMAPVVSADREAA